MADSKWGPLLAADAKGIDLRFPLIGSPKLDGIRCVMKDSFAKSRSMKPIKNIHTRSLLERHGELLRDVDGELMVGDLFNSTTSGINTILGTPDFKYHIFVVCFETHEAYFIVHLALRIRF